MSEEENKNFYVYCHQTKDDGRCFYIGKGKGRRAYSKSGRNKHWHNKVKKHGGFDVVILVNGITELKALEVEVDFISQIGLENLVNISAGGDGISGYKLSEGTKRKLSDINKGKKLSDETKEKISNSSKGKIHSKEALRKMSESKKGENNYNFGQHHSEEHRNKISAAHSGDKHYNFGKRGKDANAAKRISQYTKDGFFIQTWDSIIDAAITLGVSSCCISSCLKNRRKSSGGFIWKYYQEEFAKIAV